MDSWLNVGALNFLRDQEGGVSVGGGVYRGGDAYCSQLITKDSNSGF